MHEMSLVEAVMGVLEGIEFEGRAVRVGLSVGGLRQVVPEVMEFCFEVAARGSVYEGAALVVTRVPVVRRCGVCSRTWECDDIISLCPGCGGADSQVVTGMELAIDYIDVE